MPQRAYREGVANALIHRDYAQLGAVHVKWLDEAVEISNPGGFPPGVHLDNILVTPPRPRNPLLADALKRAGVVERTGRGVDIIFREQLRNGRPAPSYEHSNDSSVVLTLPRGKANLEFVHLVLEEERDEPLPLDALLLLNALWDTRSISTAQAARLIQKTEREARTILSQLQEKGLIEARGQRKGRTWHLSAATYRRFGHPAAYVRTRGFEPYQQEQMVVQYVKANGKITRREVSELCKLGPRQATALLRQLVDKGVLAKHGKKRGTWYELRPDEA